MVYSKLLLWLFIHSSNLTISIINLCVQLYICHQIPKKPAIPIIWSYQQLFCQLTFFINQLFSRDSNLTSTNVCLSVSLSVTKQYVETAYKQNVQSSMKVINESHPWKLSMTVHDSQIVTVSHFWLISSINLSLAQCKTYKIFHNVFVGTCC